MDILSINFNHDASLCLLRDGEVVFFAKEERLSRRKKDNVPLLAISALKEHGIEEVDVIICHILWDEQIDLDTIAHNSEFLRSGMHSKVFWTLYHIKKTLKYKQIINHSYISHHLSHANIAFYNSGFDDSLVFVADRSGSYISYNDHIEYNVDVKSAEVESLYYFNKSKNHKQPLLKNFSYAKMQAFDKFVFAKINSLYGSDVETNLSFGVAKLYSTACGLMGLGIFDAGKAMGLSSYGVEDVFKHYGDFVKKISFSNDDAPSNNFLEEAYFNKFGPRDFPIHLKQTNEVTKENFQYYANYCKYVQEVSQNVVLETIKKYVNKTGIKRVCMSGGYANNIVTNAYLKKNLPDIDFYFEPVCDDSGNTIGIAYDYYTNLSQDNRIIPPKDNFYISYKKELVLDSRSKQCDLSQLLEIFLQQKTIAIFEGKPEAGQRALGHRSIIFDARNLNGKEIVNQTKKREWYRPFAGVIRKEDFKDYFYDNGFDESPTMMINFDAKPHTCKEFPSIIHVDNTCRIQTVTEGFFYNFISLLKERTGCPIILNTSFNLAGDPLVHNVKDAIQTFDTSSIDALYFVEHKQLLLK